MAYTYRPRSGKPHVSVAVRRLRRRCSVAAFMAVTCVALVIKLAMNGGTVSRTVYGPALFVCFVGTLLALINLWAHAADADVDHLIRNGTYAGNAKRGLRRGALLAVPVALVIILFLPNFSGQGTNPHNQYGMGTPTVTASQVV